MRFTVGDIVVVLVGEYNCVYNQKAIFIIEHCDFNYNNIKNIYVLNWLVGGGRHLIFPEREDHLWYAYGRHILTETTR